MADLKLYKVTINGVEHTVQLSEKDAMARNATPVAAVKPAAKK